MPERRRPSSPDVIVFSSAPQWPSTADVADRIRQNAEARGVACVRLEAPEGRSLRSLLAPALRVALIKLDRLEAATAGAARALRALAGFFRAMRVKFGDLELRLDVEPERGLADTGDLGADLADLLESVGVAARERGTALILFVDELQSVAEAELAALITALHWCAQQELPITLVGAGLPQLVGRTGRAKSYAERLFDFPEIGRLDPDAAYRALTVPAERHEVTFTDDALTTILDHTGLAPLLLRRVTPCPGLAR